MRLSSELLQVLRQWSERDGISPEEQELAKKVIAALTAVNVAV